MGHMTLNDAPLSGVRVIHIGVQSDARGRFERLYCSEEWSCLREGLRFVQVNVSTTFAAGTIRGLHYQGPPAAEAKLIRCLHGRVYDVMVDLRRDSPTFLRWHALTLCAEEPVEVFIPEGFAHGFQALSDDVQMLYMHTVCWTPGCEGGLRHDDPALGIPWPRPAINLSERDRAHPLIDSFFRGLTL